MPAARCDPSMMKSTNKFQAHLHSIRKRTDSIWEKIVHIQAKYLTQYPWAILGTSTFLSVGLTIAILFLARVQPFNEDDFLVYNSEAMKNAQYLKKIFGHDTELRVHQQIHLYPALDIVIKRKSNDNQTNMLDDRIINEMRLLDNRIRSISINQTFLSYNYSSLCTRNGRECVVDGNYLLSNTFRQQASHLSYNPTGIYFDSMTGAYGYVTFMFGQHIQRQPDTSSSSSGHGTDPDYVDDENSDEQGSSTVSILTTKKNLKEIITYVPLFRLRYALNSSTNEARQLALAWEREALRFLNEDFHSTLIEVAPSTSTAIADVVAKQAREEGPNVTIMLLIFFVLVCLFIALEGNRQTSVGYLPICGIISFFLSTGATFGLLSICQFNLTEPMVMLVFVVAIIDCMRMSIVCGEYHRVMGSFFSTPSSNIPPTIDINKILPSILKHTHPYFFISTFTICLTYIILAIFSRLSCTTMFCLTLVIYVFINYLIHCTFFSSCLVITLKRVASRRHCLLCIRLPLDYQFTESEGIFESSRKKITSFMIPTKIRSIQKTIGAVFVACLSLIAAGLVLWALLSIDTRLFDEPLLPKHAKSLRAYMNSQEKDFDIGPVIMFTEPESINYENQQNQLAMRQLLERCRNETTTTDFSLLWLESENFDQLLRTKGPLETRLSPLTNNDLIVKDEPNGSTIVASRFYCQYRAIRGNRDDIRTMNDVYTYARQSSLPGVFPYSLVFPHYESLGQIRCELYLLIGVLFICLLVICLLSFLSLRVALLVSSHQLGLLSGMFACLYIFHGLTFNMANALWFYIVPVIFVETLVHVVNHNSSSKWKYNRVLLSLLIALAIFAFFNVQTYTFQMIRDSLIYQTIICLILINIILPIWCYLAQLFVTYRMDQSKINQTTIPIAVEIKDGTSPITTEVQNLVYEPNGQNNTSSA